MYFRYSPFCCIIYNKRFYSFFYNSHARASHSLSDYRQTHVLPFRSHESALRALRPASQDLRSFDCNSHARASHSLSDYRQTHVR